jgi:cytochrome c2
MRSLYFRFMVIGAAVAASQVRAQELGDLRQGRALAQQVCSECHAVGRGGCALAQCAGTKI